MLQASGLFTKTKVITNVSASSPGVLTVASSPSLSIKRSYEVRIRSDLPWTSPHFHRFPATSRTVEFWQRRQADWQAKELRIKFLIAGLEEGRGSERVLEVRGTLELAQMAYFFLYVTKNPAEQAELLKKVLLN